MGPLIGQSYEQGAMQQKIKVQILREKSKSPVVIGKFFGQI